MPWQKKWHDVIYVFSKDFFSEMSLEYPLIYLIKTINYLDMKRILSFITVFALLFIACEGPQGPPGFDGFDGQDGQDGGLIVSSAFEIVLDFTPDSKLF